MQTHRQEIASPRDRRLSAVPPRPVVTPALPADEAGRGANLLSRNLHPETARLAALSSWTDDPAVAPLLEALRDLLPIQDKLIALRLDGRDFANSAAIELGTLVERKFDTGRFGTAAGRKFSATGVCLTLLHHIEDIRSAWIGAKLAAEGLRSDLHGRDDRFYDRHDALSDEAEAVDAVWARFVRSAS